MRHDVIHHPASDGGDVVDRLGKPTGGLARCRIEVLECGLVRIALVELQVWIPSKGQTNICNDLVLAQRCRKGAVYPTSTRPA